jgi:hypothetical protein
MKVREKVLDKLFPSRAHWRTAAETFAKASALLDETKKTAERVIEEMRR